MTRATDRRRKQDCRSQRDELAKLLEFTRALSPMPLQLKIASGCMLLTRCESQESADMPVDFGESIAVPSVYSARCTVLANGPDGTVSGVAATFAFWLKRVWQRALDREDGSHFIPNAADMSQEETWAEFELLKACQFLGDEAGVREQSQYLYHWIVQSPCVALLSSSQQNSFTNADANWFLRLLPDFPEDMIRRVIKRGAFAILDRLPLGSNLARLACELASEAPATLRGFAQGWSRDRRQNIHQMLWERRSAIAHSAGTAIDVSASFACWKQYLRHRLPGLQASHTSLSISDRADHWPPPAVHKLKCSAPRRGGSVPVWPDALRVLELRIDGSNPCKKRQRIPFNHLRLPDQLLSLRLGVTTVCLENAVLPRHLTSLTLWHEAKVNPAAAIRLPEGLRVLELVGGMFRRLHRIRIEEFPPSLQELTLECTMLNPEALNSLERLPALRFVKLYFLTHAIQDHLSAAELATYRLPASLAELEMEGVVCGRAGVRLPECLTDLTLDPLPVNTAGEIPMALADFPRTLVSLTIDTGSYFWDPEDMPEFLNALNAEDASGIVASALSMSTAGGRGATGLLEWLKSGPLPPRLTVLILSAPFTSKQRRESLDGVQWPQHLEVLCLMDYSRCLDADDQLCCPDAFPEVPVISPRGLPDALTHVQLCSMRLSLAGVTLPAALTRLDLAFCDFVGEGALSGVTWPAGGLLQLSLDRSNYGAATHLRVQLPHSITRLSLQSTRLGRSRADRLILPRGLRDLDLEGAIFGEGGLSSLILPTQLTALWLCDAWIGPRGYEGVRLPESLQIAALQCRTDKSGYWGGALLSAHWPPRLRFLALGMPSRSLLECICARHGAADTLEVLAVCLAPKGKMGIADVRRMLGEGTRTRAEHYHSDHACHELRELFCIGQSARV